MGDRRVDAALAPDDRRIPRLVPEARQLDGRPHGGDRMRRAALDRPPPQRRVEIGEQAGLEVVLRGAGAELRVDGGRPLDDVGQGLAVEQRQRIGEHHPRHPLARQLRGARHHHAAGAGADQHDVLQIVEEQQAGNFVGVRLGGDAGADLALALGAAVEAGRQHAMALRAQALGDRFPDPAALVGAVQQYEIRHHLFPSLTETPARRS